MKKLYVRPGAKDNTGNPVGFKAEERSQPPSNLLQLGFVPQGEQEAPPAPNAPMFTAKELGAMTVEQLKELATANAVTLPPDANKKAEIVDVLAAHFAEQE